MSKAWIILIFYKLREIERKRRRGRASHHEEYEAIGSFLLPCAATGLSLVAMWCLSGATPRGEDIVERYQQ